MDLIERQAAIDELDKGAWGVEWDKTLAKFCPNCGADMRGEQDD